MFLPKATALKKKKNTKEERATAEDILARKFASDWWG